MNLIHEHHDAEDEVIKARALPVHLEMASDDDDTHVLKGWVNCPLNGHLDVESCSVCPYSQGIRLTANKSAPEVLCGWLATERAA